MSNRAAEELLFDSEATLRLVDNVLDELQVMEAEVSRSEDRVRTLSDQIGRAHAGIADLPGILLRAHDEIHAVLGNLRQSRDVLERTTVERIHQMNDKLREVSCTTELAATDILDGLERSLALVDRLEATEADAGAELRGKLRVELRDELFGVMTCMQFHDITSQQLAYAASVLQDVEGRLGQIALLFDSEALGVQQPAPPAASVGGDDLYDPTATTRDAGARQAMADQLFSRGHDGR